MPQQTKQIAFKNILKKLKRWNDIGGIYNFFHQEDFFSTKWSTQQTKIKLKYIQQCPNWYFATKKENVRSIVNKTTKQNN